MLTPNATVPSVEKERVLPRYLIHVADEVEHLTWAGLVPILESLLPIKFCFGNEPVSEKHWELNIEGVSRLKRDGGRPNFGSFSLPRTTSPPTGDGLVDIPIRFADDPEVPFPFRARSVLTKIAAGAEFLSVNCSERILAVGDHGPVWTVSDGPGVKHFRSALNLPAIDSAGGLKDVLNENRFLEMLPLLHWLRKICAGTIYENPPLRACFIFDDPNLHWPRYGFIDYQQVALHAEQKNYHVSFATIPLDAWFTHQPTAEIFRNNASRLSLVVHGNNHWKQEFAQHYTPAGRVDLLMQVIYRVGRLERAAGFPVCRVIVPPHGACSEEMLGELPRCDFEAACISHGSLRAHNKGKFWTKTVGLLPSELIQGCPVLPRWGMTGDISNAILLAAFLGQPIILRGHHQDLKGGIELLDRLADFINGLGAVTWSNMTGLCRMNFQWRAAENACAVTPLGKKIKFLLPSGTTQLTIESPQNGFTPIWRIKGAGGTTLLARSGENILLPSALNGWVSIMADSAAIQPSFVNGANSMSPAAFFRRMLTECRDRILSFS